MAVESGREPLLHSPYHFCILTVTRSLPLLILLFSESHYYLSHVIWLSLRVLGSGGKICPLCPNLTADHRGPMFSPSGIGPWRVEREVGGRSHNYHFCTLVITNRACLACVLSMITMHATNFRRTPLLINLG